MTDHRGDCSCSACLKAGLDRIQAILADRRAEIAGGLLKAENAAAYLNVSVSTLQELSRRRRVPYRLRDGRRYWARTDLDAYIAGLPIAGPSREIPREG
jgi:Helix-turn-helix domain